MPKAYAVVTYRSVCDPGKLAAYTELAWPCAHSAVGIRKLDVASARVPSIASAHPKFA